MRLAFSVLALLIVAYVVMTLAQKQAQVLVPRAASAAATASASASARVPLPQQVQRDVQDALSQGMQQRASEPGQ